MTHTPSPTVIEEDRALIEALSRPMVRTALEVKALDYIRDGRGDDSEAVQLAAAHRELGERRAEAAVVGQTAQIAALTEALTPSGDTKSAYMGEFYVRLPDLDDGGNEVVRKINVPWTTIKEIMAAIRDRALAPKDTNQ